MVPNIGRIVREELLRSIAWAGLGLFGWAILITESARLEATVLTVLGLPVLTWALVTASMIGIRFSTGAELTVQSKDGILAAVVLGVILGGFGVVYLVTIRDQPLVVLGGLYGTIVVLTLGWFRYVVLPSYERRDLA